MNPSRACNPSLTDSVATKDFHVDPFSSLSLRAFLPDTSVTSALPTPMITAAVRLPHVALYRTGKAWVHAIILTAVVLPWLSLSWLLMEILPVYPSCITVIVVQKRITVMLNLLLLMV
ncbi:hypothetical protein OIU76_010494 [Salix suchowensis]|nr:hypothetical protein OIU76_010494 [Salix suchowensis]